MPSQYLIKLLHKCSWWKQFNFHFCFIIEVLIVWHIISIFFLTGLIWIKSGYAAGCKKVLNYGGTNFPLPVNVTEHFPSPCSSDLHIIHIQPHFAVHIFSLLDTIYFALFEIYDPIFYQRKLYVLLEMKVFDEIFVFFVPYSWSIFIRICP